MNLYLACFRLNLPLIAFSNLISLYSYHDSHNLFIALVLKLIALPVLIFLFSPFVKSYAYFFYNKGWNIFKQYSVIASIDFGIFLSFVSLTLL